jgi:hypothetical protein
MYVRSTALVIAIVFVGIVTTILPAAAANSHARHHHPAANATSRLSKTVHTKKHHARESSAASAGGERRSARQAKLLATLRAQQEQLYALRHERNVYAERIAHLSEIVRSSKPRGTSGRRVAVATAKSRADKHGQANHSSERQVSHQSDLAAKHATALRLHQEHLAVIQAHAQKLWNQHLQRLAQIEAERQKHADNNSKAVHIASDSGLPVWEGDAYAAQVPVKVVTVDLNDPRIKVSALLARNGIGTSEPFTDMIDRTHPYVAVTGTFFSLDNLRPVGDIVINGSLAYFGGMGTALAIKPNNHADMITVPWGHHHDWSGYQTVVACGPRLLEDGNIVLDPRLEHFKDRDMLAPNSRIAVGITAHNQLVFCMTRDAIYLGRLAKIMRSLGCRQAMNLDAGTSTGFYCNGRLMARPGRWLTNAIVVYADGNRHTVESERPARDRSERVARQSAQSRAATSTKAGASA